MRNMMHPQSYFARLPQPMIQRSQFDRSSNLLTTMEVNTLQPIYLDEVLPGDTFNLTTNLFARLSTPLKPYMDNLYIDVHAFFVPNRLTWEHWVNFMGEETDPTLETQPTYSVPQMEFDGPITPGTTAACLGLPLTNAPLENTTVSALPFRAIRKIYDDWYRDENFEKIQLLNITDVNDEYAADGFAPLFKRWKVKDYFTGALPWAQKGDPITMNIGGTAPVTGFAPVERLSNAPGWKVYLNGSNTLLGTAPLTSNAGNMVNGGSQQLSLDPTPGALRTSFAGAGVTADLSTSSGITINDFRNAVTLQQYLERDARFGTRYIESLYGHWGVVNPDFRLQRAEFISSTRVNINVVPVAQTAPESGDSPQGNLAGFSTASSQGGLRFSKTFTEHGYLIVLASVVADLHYQNGIERMWSRQTKFDFYDPIFANLGEQAILNKELAITDDPEDDDAAFGYQEAWADYRYKPSYITNLMNSNATTSIDYWHLAEDFATTPTLSKTFLQYNTPFDRIVAVPSEPPVILNGWFRNKTARCMPVRSIPGLTKI